MKPVGIVVALAAECRSLGKWRAPEGGCLPLANGCLLALSGAGPKAAERAAERLANEGVTSLISWGCAAALSPRLQPGDLALPSRLIGADGTIQETDSEWRNRLSARLAAHLPIHNGDLAESAEIIATAAAKQVIYDTTGAIVLDMESAAVSRTALSQGIPFMAIRAIADPAAMTVPGSILDALDDDGKVQIPKLLSRVLQKPTDFLGLIHLGWHFHAAMKTLSKVAAIAGEGFLAPAVGKRPPNPNP